MNDRQIQQCTERVRDFCRMTITMPDATFDQIAETKSSDGPVAAIDRLIETLREERKYHKLFDARMLKRKFELGLPLSRPSTLSDVPEDLRKDVEETYIEAAREAGELLLEEGNIPEAWMYLKVIREPEKVAAKIEETPVPREYEPGSEQILNIALYEGVHPVKGIEMMLASQGTCSTITTLDQVLHNLSPGQRRECARLMVRSLYSDLRESVLRHVQQRMPTVPPNASLRELLAGRDWIFEGGNYHVDVSHLSAVVRFARSIEAPAEELELALQMAEYGSHLDSQLQYAAEPPFEDFYPAHIAFLKVLLGKDVDPSLQYFRDKLDNEPDEQDKPLLAYVLVDLLMRSDRLDEAVDVAAQYLTNLGEDVSFSFAELCREAGRLDALQRVMRERDDLVGYTAALLQEESGAVAAE
ncbi:MAG: hypothetical protein DWQ34_19060 [Planctomycetota bacterium]|nr:MAG: hypothetical protein DWQ34_19060 [Planctomycetota bacterium]REK24334.1 MAG: hypothetical protein DWQ41_15030 [Planctomycetota bacterium]REK38525.1 MAG: hypothetical protein DWQ45_03825 [Planctomycetota bacterium]